jgi:polyisoprenoid-binding protein YceI
MSLASRAVGSGDYSGVHPRLPRFVPSRAMNESRSPRTLAAVALFGLLVAAQRCTAQETYVIDSTHTTPMFEIAHLGMSQQRGFFTNTIGRITLDRGARRGAIDVEIGTGSVLTASRVLNDVLKRDDYFNSEKFPVMRFTSRDLVFDGDAPVAANGEFTLLGVTRPLMLRIAGFKCGLEAYTRRPMCGAEASATIRRSEFGMTSGLPAAVGDEVHIVIPVEAMKE